MLFAILFWLSCASASVPYINVGGYPWVTDVTPGLNWGTAVGCGQDFILNAYYAIGDAQYLGQAAFDSDVTWVGSVHLLAVLFCFPRHLSESTFDSPPTLFLLLPAKFCSNIMIEYSIPYFLIPKLA